MENGLLFIANKQKNYYLNPLIFKNQHKYLCGYLHLESLTLFKTKLKEHFGGLKVIYICLVAPIEFDYMLNSEYKTYNLKHCNLNLFFNILKEINDTAQYHIISAACYGFYMHEYFPLLNKGSSLITLSDYSSQTYKFNQLYDIVLSLPENVSVIDYIMSKYLNLFTYSLNTPVIFFSYYIAKNTYKIDCLFNYIKAKYYPNVFYTHDILNIKFYLQEIFIIVPESVFIQQSSLILNLRLKTDYDVHYNLSSYCLPSMICKEINELIRLKKELCNTYKLLYKMYPCKTIVYSDIDGFILSLKINVEIINLLHTNFFASIINRKRWSITSWESLHLCAI